MAFLRFMERKRRSVPHSLRRTNSGQHGLASRTARFRKSGKCGQVVGDLPAVAAVGSCFDRESR
jgi:hypothetical protein